MCMRVLWALNNRPKAQPYVGGSRRPITVCFVLCQNRIGAVRENNVNFISFVFLHETTRLVFSFFVPLSPLCFTLYSIRSFQTVASVGEPTPKESAKRTFVTVVRCFRPYLHWSDLRCLFEINVGLLCTADNSVACKYLLGLGDGPKVDRNGRWSGRSPPPAPFTQGFAVMTPLLAKRWNWRLLSKYSCSVLP